MRPQRILRRLRAELRLSGIALWRGLVELVNSNDVTHAASIAYYALLSLFPFALMLLFNVVSPGFFDPLTSTTVGALCMTVAFLFWAASIGLARKILAVDI